MKQLITLKINGKSYEVAVESRKLLVDVLRDNLGLTGTKKACDFGNCGSCTIIMDGKPALSCLTLAIEAQDKDILTIEGMARNGQLHPLQQAFVDYGAIQCGFCTPGMILSALALLNSNPNPTRKEVETALAGNLCRCTGYVKIVDAVLAAAEAIKTGKKQHARVSP